MPTRLKSLVNSSANWRRLVQGFLAAFRLRHGRKSPAPVLRFGPGRPLRLLLVGYCGSRNTGADARVHEMVRQLRHILGPDHVDLAVTTTDPRSTEGYFQGARQLRMRKWSCPWFLFRTCPQFDGVVACEGSMFKSKFASALTLLMVQALGNANLQGKLSVGYGAEADAMTPELRAMVARHCRPSLILCRNQATRAILQELGLRTAPGTDTAWTFEPSGPERARGLLAAAGADPEARHLAICPINPFWWPVEPSLAKAILRLLTGRYADLHHASIYFHAQDGDARRQYEAYIDGLAQGIRRFTARQPMPVVLYGMERLDRRACQDLAQALGRKVPILVSDTYDMFDMVGMLRQARLLLSSRYHALVTTMPARVPSAGVSMDERIANLLAGRGHDRLCLAAGDPGLGGKVLEVLQELEDQRPAIVAGIERDVARQLEGMGRMGMAFEQELLRVLPGFPVRTGQCTWQEYLPDLPAELEAYASGGGAL